LKLEGYQLVFFVVGLIGILLIATPALSGVIHFQSGAQFSELYLLNTDHMAKNYPFNILPGQNYSIFVVVGNHLGSLANYVMYVKFNNSTDQMPITTSGAPSPSQPLFEYRFSIQDGKNWESLFTFSVSDASFSENRSLVKTLTINDEVFEINKPVLWDSNSTRFSYSLLFELWIYNSQTSSITFNNRYVNLPINLM
jgi:hypothetical protein